VEPAPSLAPPPPAVAETPRPPSTPPPPAAAAEPFHRAESSVRVSVRVLDRLMTLAGEMVLTRNQLLQGTRVNDPYQVERAAQRVDHVTAELQDAVMATRMQSIRIVFDKFKRTVRDLATSLGKRVRLELEGEDVELDRTVIEAIGDPLSHLVRNAIGHGIELPDERMAGGKPAEGILRLSAEHKAGHVVIEVVDDGRGIDVERVVQRAIDSGVVAPHELRGMSSKWLLNLIFRPGVSTAHSVTRLSGRGVGLDAVHAGLSGIGGTVEVESAPGRGCTFRVKLPLTLAILPSLLVEAQAERFAIPQVHLLELLRIRQDEIPERTARIGTVDVLRLRGSLLPLVRLRDVLGMSAPTWRDERTGELRPDEREAIADRRGGEDDEADRRAPERRETGERRQALASALYVAVVAAGDHDYGIIVDHLLDSVEIVVKPLGRHLSRCACYAGATVLGDGLPALILDIAGLAREAGIAEKSEAARRERRHEERRADDVGDRIAVLLLRSGEAETLGVPLDLIERITKVERRAIETAGGRRVLKYRGASLPLFSADEAAAVSPLCDNDRLFVLVFRMGERLLGLLASEIIDSMETEGVIDELTHRQPGIFGSTFIGERLVLLVDPRDVVARVVPAWTELLATATAAAPSESHTVLVVEDSSFFLNHIAQMMEEEGYAVDTAEDGAVALEKLRRSPGRFDIVLTDIEMPVLDGFGLVERMRADDKLEGVPVIAITSLMDRESRERGLAVGIDEYTIKLDRDQVLERCRTLLAHGREAP